MTKMIAKNIREIRTTIPIKSGFWVYHNKVSFWDRVTSGTLGAYINYCIYIYDLRSDN